MEIGRHSMETEESKVELGLHTISHGFNKEIEETVTKIIDGSLRSGKRIEFDGSLVILGDVNAGAEVIAREHIIVMGVLRGLAHAGAKGNREAMIVANDIDAVQLRIADIVKEIEILKTEEPEEEEQKKSKDRTKGKEEQDEEEYYDDIIKTRAYVKDGEIVLE
ncbi:MAG: septum site-determining protein MinC [Clostridia bacterium]|nr:septum site-determining protein MinC [Clostridia bacterium]